MTAKVNIMTDSALAHHVTSTVAAAVCRKVGMLRRERRLSFDQLALRSGVSKGLLVQLEQGNANPSIGTLCRIASALGASVAEIVDASETQAVRIAGEDAHIRLWSGPKGGHGTLVIGSEGPDMLEFWRWELRPGESHSSPPHTPGTREILCVQSGELVFEADGVEHKLRPGHALCAPTDRSHSYGCSGRHAVHFTMVVAEPGRKPPRP